MAHSLALARSFYSWIAKIELNETDEKVKKVLPKTYPTSPAALYDMTGALCEGFWGTKHYPRACYWNEIFESMSGELDEGLRRMTIDLLKKFFIPKRKMTQETNKSFILRKLQVLLNKVKVAYEQIDQSRKGFPAYQFLKSKYKEGEADALARTLNWFDDPTHLDPDIKNAPEPIRKKKKYALACLRVALGSAVWGTFRTIFTAGFGSRAALSIAGGSAEFAASAAREAVTSRTSALAALAATVLYIVTVAFGEQSARDIFPN